jgi:hypothetical protein
VGPGIGIAVARITEIVDPHQTMPEEHSESSESGHPIYRHQPREDGFQPAFGEEVNIQLISDHITRHIGEPATVFHELISDLVHIDIHIVAPTAGRNYYTLVSSGMSDRPMTVPPQAADFAYGELMLSLPSDWPMSQEDFKSSRNYWPVELLKFLARMPHEYQTWLSYEHTIPNGDPAEPFDNSVAFSGAMLAPPRLVPMEFHTLDAGDGKTIRFYAVLPVYREEMDLKLKLGADALYERLDKIQVSELLDVRRKNVAKRFLGLF